MPIVDARPSAVAPVLVSLAASQAGTGDTTNTADLGSNIKANSVKLRITSALGATPTCTYQIQVSPDNSNWVNATYADVSTPTTDVATTFTISAATVSEKIIKNPTTWRYIKVTMSANTNVTNTIDVLVDYGKRWV